MQFYICIKGRSCGWGFDIATFLPSSTLPPLNPSSGDIFRFTFSLAIPIFLDGAFLALFRIRHLLHFHMVVFQLDQLPPGWECLGHSSLLPTSIPPQHVIALRYYPCLHLTGFSRYRHSTTFSISAQEKRVFCPPPLFFFAGNARTGCEWEVDCRARCNPITVTPPRPFDMSFHLYPQTCCS